MQTQSEVWCVGPLRFSKQARSEVLDQVVGIRSAKGATIRVVTPNIYHLRLADRDPLVADAINRSDLVLADGWPISIALRILYGDKRGRITGSDLTLQVLERAETIGASVGIIGGSDESLSQAVRNVKKSYPALRVVEFAENPFLPDHPTTESVSEFVSIVNSSPPDILLLCMGAPKSELHLDQAALALRSHSALCVGATVDFLAGTKVRAPKLVQRVGLEWAFRLVQEPRRLLGRYAASGAAYGKILTREIFRQGSRSARGVRARA